jgi:hypothetical protein
MTMRKRAGKSSLAFPVEFAYMRRNIAPGSVSGAL